MSLSIIPLDPNAGMNDMKFNLGERVRTPDGRYRGIVLASRSRSADEVYPELYLVQVDPKPPHAGRIFMQPFCADELEFDKDAN